MLLTTRGLAALLCAFPLAACKRSPSAPPANGSIVLAVRSTRPVDHVLIKAYDASGKQALVTFDTTKDLTKDTAVGEISQGMTQAQGPVLFAGFGYTKTSTAVVVSGKVIAQFEAGKRTDAQLDLEADLVDVDQDGYTKQEDCNDNASAQSPFYTEICANDADDNCDGSVDEGCRCNSGEQRTCYTGPPLSRNVGECRDGFQTCDGGVWGACKSSVTPQKQFCENGQDGNCDGSIDEGCPCTAGSSRFCWGRFVTRVAEPASVLTQPQGECRAGTQTCEGTSWGLCKDAVYARAEVCNGLDDDCDGARDEDGFDRDGDGYTTCGTLTAAVAAANQGPCIGKTESAGVDDALKDCDDSDPGRHPCQVDRCGDANTDDNCDGSFNECQTPLACADAGYYGGWIPAKSSPSDTETRLEYQCARSGGLYGNICLATRVCTDEGACPAQTTPGVPTGFERQACHEKAGCGAGSMLGPQAGTPIASGDAYNDCGGVSCDQAGLRVFAGGSAGAPSSGWRVVNDAAGAGKHYECHVYAPVDAAHHDCASGGCESATQACLRTGLGGATLVSSAAGSVIASACSRPSGSSGDNYNPGTYADNGSSCVTTVSTSIAPSAVAVLNAPDPLRRCTNGNLATCANKVITPFGATNTCSYVSVAPSTLNFCEDIGGLGRCVSGVPSAGQCTAGAGAATANVTCTASCRNIAGCGAGGTVDPNNICFNANGGAAGGACGAGQTCLSSAGGGGDISPKATCQTCAQDAACGSSCSSCSAEQECKSGVDPAANGFDPPDAGNAANNACFCTSNLVGNTIRIHCGTACCAAGQFCSNAASSTCANLSSPLKIACSGAECDRASQYCNVTGAVPTCQTLSGSEISCNQRACNRGTQACTSFSGSSCSDCASGKACNTVCCGAGLVACSDFDTSTCAPCDESSQCGAMPDTTCAASQACTTDVSGTNVCSNYSCVAVSDSAAQASHKSNSCCGRRCAACGSGSTCQGPSATACTNANWPDCTCQ